MRVGRVAPLGWVGLLVAVPADGAVDPRTSGLRQCTWHALDDRGLIDFLPRKVIVLSRHGVRGPYGMGTEAPSEEMMNKYVRNPDVKLPLSAYEWGTSGTDDPRETVSPKLTKHGFFVVERMGEYFRDHMYREFLNATCKETFAYADNNERDNVTAVAFLSGLYPLCEELVPMTEKTQFLFEQGQDPTAKCPVCSKAMYEGITGNNDTMFVLPEIREEVAVVNDVLQCCAASVCNLIEESASINSTQSPTTCDLFGIPTKWNGAFYLPWRDTLSNADYFSEWLLLQSLNNMSLPSQLSFEKVLSLAKIHETHMDLITNEINSASFGGTLLAHLTASFEQNVLQKTLPVAKGDGPHLAQGPENRLLYYAAHDINLLYVRNLLRLQWYTKGWHPHQPVPGSMLVFELHATPAKTNDQPSPSMSESRKLQSTTTAEEYATWRTEGENGLNLVDDSRFYVKLYFVAASPQQIRNGDKLSPENPPDRVQVTIPSCSKEIDAGDGTTDIRCPFSTFKKLIGKTLNHACVADTLRPFVESLIDEETMDKESAANRIWGVETSGSGRLNNSSEVAAVHETLLWAVSSCLVLLFVVLMIRHTVRHHLRRQAFEAIPLQ
uniref:Acid phosphatase n=1 Tax=Peronospora matthiolae TaxID=2874970 RepID=A0AAV1SZD6_9STRA